MRLRRERLEGAAGRADGLKESAAAAAADRGEPSGGTKKVAEIRICGFVDFLSPGWTGSPQIHIFMNTSLHNEHVATLPKRHDYMWFLWCPESVWEAEPSASRNSRRHMTVDLWISHILTCVSQ